MDQSVASSLPTTEGEQLFLAIADGGYLVAAGDGIVRECGADLAERVGVSVGSAVGRPVTELLPAWADGGDGFARALDGPDRDFAVATPGGAALRARVIPVPLTLGWEVTALLGDLGVRDTETWSVGSLRAQHGPAMDAILDSAQAEAGARLAGILVVVRPPDGEQLDREGIAERRARRATAALAELAAERDAAVAAVGAPAPPPASLPATAPDDALADLVEQARELRRRLDDAEAAAASAALERDRVRAQCDAALGALDSVSAELEDAHRERERLQAEYEEAAHHREALHADGDEAARARDALGAQLEAAETERDGLAGRLAEASAHAEALAARLVEATAHGEALQGELAQATQAHALVVDERDELLAARDTLLGERDALVAERDSLAGERGALAAERDGLVVDREALVAECEELAAERDGLLQERDTARAGAADAGQLVAELDQVRAAGTRLRAELDAVHAELTQVRAELEEERAARAEVEAALRGALDDLAAAGAERDAAARRVRELAEDAARVQSAATTIRTELGLDRPPAPQPVPATAAAAVPAAGSDPSVRPALPTAPGRAFAVVGPDGCFTRLDDAFCSLLGYRENDLRQAGWPSIIDSDNAREHRELARALRAGELAEAEVQTFYMHACGLLVGVGARVTPSPVPGLDIDHLLVEVDVTNAAAPAAHRP